MTLAPGTRIGPYEITGSLGAGGMGEVYRARDSRLERDVAIKILPERWLRDQDRRARFDREARALASLNHPHIGAIYGIEEGDGVRALVLELIAGPTLADWLTHGPVAVRDALRIAVQIASALDAAHERGIIHRDLKPANVILRGARRSTAARPPSGPRKPDSGPGGELTVKVVDFGLAKEFETAEAGADLHDLPTRTQEATREGVLIGTVAYMSPEQARGERVDQRTDLWAFGCVLYEMLTGRAPFGGASLPDTLAAIVAKDPDWSALPSDTPAEVRRVLRRCLEKEWHQRLRDAGDVRIALEDTAERHDEGSPLPTPALAAPKRDRSAVLLALAAVVFGLVVGWLVSRWLGARDRPQSASPLEMRLEITTPPTYDPVALAVSQDGKQLAFVASSGGRSMLWVRALDSTSARPFPGTEGASYPFWSPDGGSIAFFADRHLRRIDLELGTVQVLAPADGGRGGAWGPDGSIVFQPSPRPHDLVRISSSGGPPLPLEPLIGRFPHFLPDGRHFLYHSYHSRVPDPGVFIAAVDGSGARQVLAANGAAVYSSGHLLFVRGSTLLAQRFDLASLAVTGNVFPVAADLHVTFNHAPLSAAAEGPIVFRAGSAAVLRQFVWRDRAGREIAKLGHPMAEAFSPSLAPDESSVAFHMRVEGNNDIWRLDAARGALERFTTDAANEFNALFSPDGTRVAFSKNGLVERSILGGAESERVLRRAGDGRGLAPHAWAPDGRYLLYSGESDSIDLWVLPVDPPAEPIPFARTKFAETDGEFSPDGAWIAYTTDESGRPEVYLSRFPGAAAKMLISTAGGGMPRWRGDGRELYYIALDERMMAVPLDTSDGGETLRASAPVALFDAGVGAPMQTASHQQYEVAEDGKRFLLNAIAEQDPPPITVILNWQP